MELPKELSARAGFSGGGLDRQSERRDDDAYIAALKNDSKTRFFAISGQNVWLERGPQNFRAMFYAPEIADFGAMRENVFLGCDAQGAVFAALIDDPPQDLGPTQEETTRAYKGRAPIEPGLHQIDLRVLAAQGMVEGDILGQLAQAKATLYWHARHRFCSNCGQPTQAGAAGWKRVCESCGAEHFPRTDPVVIMLAVQGDHCLLGRQARFPKNMYSALAGFVEAGETIEEAVRREIAEEAGVLCGGVRYLGSQPWPFPCSLMIGCLAEALTSDIKIDAEELEDARWFSRQEVLAMVEGRHPQYFCPPKMAIAHHLLAAWARNAT